MKKLFVIGLIFIGILAACRDEINLPEYNSYVDGESPRFEIVYPNEDTTIIEVNNFLYENNYRMIAISNIRMVGLYKRNNI